MTNEDPVAQSIDWLVKCGWEKKEAINLAAAIKADTPEKLWKIGPLWLEHCGESMRYVNDMLGSVAMGLMNVTQGENGEWMFALNDKGMGVGKKLNEDKS